MKRLLSCACVVLATACAKSDEAPAAEDATHAEVAATIVTIDTQHFAETVDANGIVTARAGRVAALSAAGPTRVVTINTSVGAIIKKGDALIELERAPFEANALSTDAALAAALAAAERTQRLATAGVLPRKEAEQAAAELAQARATSAAAHRLVDLATVRSPIDGVVTRVSTGIGANVDVGQTLVDVTDVSQLEIALTVSIKDARRVVVGQSVIVHSGPDATDTSVATGRVLSVAATVDTNNLGVSTRVSLPQNTTAVRLGETAFGRIVVREHADAIVIPLESLVPDGDAFKVFVVDSSDVAHARTVVVGARTDRGAWITDGLKRGERIVTTGAYGVSDGATVAKDSVAKDSVAKGKGA